MIAILESALPLAGAGIGAYLVYRLGLALVNRRPAAARRVKDFLEEERENVVFGSRVHRTRLAFARLNIDITGAEERAVWTARVILGLAVVVILRLFVGLPWAASLVGFLGGYWAVNGLVEGVWAQTRLELEREIPVFFNSFSSTIQVTQDVLQAVEEEAMTLAPNGPLQRWLRTRFLQVGSSKGQEGIQELIAESYGLSSSLGVMVFLIGRLWETGGGEWKGAFQLASGNLESVLDARLRAQAVGEGAKGSVKVIAAMTMIMIVSMVRNPGVAEAMNSPIVQIAYAGVVAMMIFGWFFINNLIDNLL